MDIGIKETTKIMQTPVLAKRSLLDQEDEEIFCSKRPRRDQEDDEDAKTLVRVSRQSLVAFDTQF